MNEYTVSFTALKLGTLLLDIHLSSGTSRYVEFQYSDIRGFLGPLGFDEDKIGEIEALCAKLQPGETYHEKMFLPPGVVEAVEESSKSTEAAA
jgi:hypothetical protein